MGTDEWSWFTVNKTIRRMTFGLNVFLAFALAALMTVVFASQAPAAPAPPALASFSESSPSVTAGSTETFTAEITSQAGLPNGASILAVLPSGANLASCDGTTLISGTTDDGIYQQTCPIPSDAPNGTYTARVIADDTFGQTLSTVGGTFQVTGGTTATPPALASFSESSPSVTAGSTETFTAEITSQAGLPNGASILAVLPSGANLASCDGTTLISGTTDDGIYQQTCPIPSDAPNGTYTARVIADDTFGQTLSTVGGTFQVTGGTTATPPALASFSESSPSVTAGSTETFTAEITSQAGLPNGASILAVLPSGANLASCDGTTLISGTTDDGIYQQTCPIPSDAPNGTYTARVIADDTFGQTLSTVGGTFQVTGGTTATDTVAFNSDGGTAISSLSGPDGSSITLPSDTQTGYTFDGWFTSAIGGTEVGVAGASYAIPSGGVTLYAQWTPTPKPTVSAVSPSSGPTSGGTSITITGTGFVSGATVVIGQGKGTTGAIAATSVTVVSPTEITAATGGGALAGTFNVFVTSPAGTSGANSGDLFAYEPESAPTVSAVSPSSGPTSGGTSITITGTGFVSGATVVIGQGKGTTGAIAATSVTVVSPTEITAATGGGALAGTFNVFVTSPAGTSGANSGDLFAYEPESAPTVSAVSPSSGPTSGGTSITITGTGFVSGATVVIGQGKGTTGAIAATSVTVVSPTEITAATGGGALAGTFNVFVTSPAGTSGANSGDDFSYTS